MSSILLNWFFVLTIVCVIKVNCKYLHRPKIKTSDGDLLIVAAFDKNIFLQSNGPKSSIFINNVDILKTKIANTETRNQPSTNLDEQLNGENGILQRLEILEDKIQNFAPTAFNMSLWRKVNRLNRKIIALQNIINNRPKDECDSQPCQHGGTCLNLVDGYHCLCPSNWEGPDCDVDVNECRNFAGTDLGCQNGAKCINKPGTYECSCKPNWYGIHCTKRSKDCSSGNSEMCGHGICIPVTSGEGVHCICNQGWTNNATSIACLTDVNECESYQGPRCSVNPKVECINVPGSFQCGQCPAGYEGDGYICNDINECITIPNGGCSPQVSCHNTIGSRICGSCPPGYQGDGVTCSYRGTCNIDHGGCHPSARCLEEPSPIGLTVQCMCPQGMKGNGIGLTGCYISEGNNSRLCENNPCGDHGRCRVNDTSYTCICDKGYGGTHCDKLMDVCEDNPCQNGGTCRQNTNTGFRCECTTIYTGSLCQVRLRSCGGVFDSVEGSIEFPLSNTSSTYNHNTECVWLIHTDTDKVLNVTFRKFNIAFSPECARSFLQIHNGRKSSSDIIGRFCGDLLPKGGNILSSQNNLYLWFHLSESVAKARFELHWTSEKPICGGEINATRHGHISYPDSPGSYPPNRDCYWHLKTTPGKRISLQFFAFDIEMHTNCSFDYLAIYNGRLITDPLLKRYCNTTQPPSLQSASFNLLLHFHSDAFGSGKGFQIAYDTIEGIPGCGGNYGSDKGEISSPSYNGLYMNNLLCEYKIMTSSETKIKIQFMLFKLINSIRCENDYLKIFDGPSSDSQLVGKFCGTENPSTFTSSSNILYVQFRTDLTMVAEGFRISYEAVCENTLIGDSGIIKTPMYPFGFPHDKVCVYLVKAELGKAIELAFQDFDVKSYFSFSKCRFVNVEVRDGPDMNSTLLGTFCGSLAQMPRIQTSTYNYMYIKFKSGTTMTGRGFYANYTVIDTECGGIYKNSTGVINYPPEDAETYKNDQHCLWLINSPEGIHIKVTWARFDIENMPGCSSDYLELSEIDDSNKINVLGKYCGARAPPAFISFSNRLKLKFVSNKIVRSTGFSLSYKFLDEMPHCGGDYVKSHGTINFRGRRTFDNSIDCTWTITVPVGQQISLNIVNLDLEELVLRQCKYANYLEIRNGVSETSPLIGQYCGKLQSYRITSFTNVLHIHFHSNYYRAAASFIIEWDSTITGCGGTLTGYSGTIHSPNYPYDYHENAECFYKIVISAGSRIGILFTELELERTFSCHKDYIEIYDGRDTDAPSLGKYCYKTSDLANITTTSNLALIKFRSDSFVSAKGFVINYHTICNNSLTGQYGVIESPGYPNGYPSGFKCWWNVQVSKGSTINVKFTHFDIAMKSWALKWAYYPTTNTCYYDYLQIRDILERNSTHKYCGSSLPNSINTTSHSIEIHFSSESYTPFSGFRLEWARHGCGGHIRKEFGSLYYDKSLSYEKTVVCEWLIETTPGKSIHFRLITTFMSGSQNCASDAIEIYNGKSIKAPLLSKICHEGEASIISDNNFMVVRFIKLSDMKDAKFYASYFSVPSKCGSFKYSMSGFIYSPNYPKNYGNNLNCIWHIAVPANRIEIDFIEFDLYSNSFSDLDRETGDFCGDAILIYDHYTASSNYTYRSCPNSNKTQIVTKYDSVDLQFKTDGYGTAKGFKAKFSAICGAVILASRDGIISNHKYVNHSNKSCVWTIIAPSTDQKISITISRMSLPKDANVITNRNCPSAFLRLYDGNDENAPLIDEFCGKKLPPTVVSHGNAVTIELGSYTDGKFGDFSAHYSTITNACGGNLTAEEGTIASPSYPMPYPINVDCEWVLRTSPGNTAYITFERFALEYSDGCNEDYLEIRENDGGGKLLGVYCGIDIPTNQTNSATIYIKFRSNSKIGGQGFLLHFGYLHENLIQGTEGQITSPLYPARYKGAGEYNWRITTDAYNIVLVIYNLEIPSFGEVSYNKLIIYDGYDTNSPIIKELHGAISNKITIQTSSTIVYITLKMDATNTGTIFRLNWMKSSQNNQLSVVNCGSNQTELILMNKLITLNSPNYPKQYGSNLHCEWIYKVQMGRHLSIMFTTLDLRETYQCYGDSISIYSADIIGHWKLIKHKICNAEAVRNEIYSSNYMKVTFTSMPPVSPGRKGFQAAVKSKCGGVITDLSGEFGPTWFDANTTFSSNQQLVCNWIVKGRPGRMIKLKFSHFNISNENSDCKTTIVLRNGDSVEGPLLASGKYCGDAHEKKTDIISSGNSLFVTYTSSFSVPFTYQTFKIYFEEQNDECGVTATLSLDHSWEVINSPNYPSIPIPYSECEWLFNGPRDVILRIDFIERFDIDDDRKYCGSEVVEIRDGATDLSPVIGRFCGHKPATIKSSGHSIYIKYVTQLAVPRNGFKANVSMDLCGGTIISNSGEVTSPRYPQMQVFPHGTICEWNVEGLQTHIFLIKFLDINLPLSQSKCETKIEIEDITQVNTSATILKTICNDNNNSLVAIESPSNRFTIKLTIGKQNQWDPVSEYRGFRISFTSSQAVCGSRITASEGYLTTPNYPQETAVIYCYWAIEIPNKSRRIRLEIIDSNREKHKIKIYNDLLVSEIKTIHNINSVSNNQVYESVANKLRIHITLYPSARSHRFKAKFTSDEQALCGGDLSDLNQDIVTPDLQQSYSCDWHYNNQVPTSQDSQRHIYKTIFLTINSNSSISRQPCDLFNPLILIRSPITNNGLVFDRKVCGNSTVSYRIPSSVIDITASRSENDSFHFTLNLKSQPCGGIINVGVDPVNIITTTDSYNDTLDCAWILVDPESRIQINMEGSFLLDCDDEYVKIMSSVDHSIPLGSYCKDNLMEASLLTHFAHMYIEYHSNMKINTNIKLIAKSVKSQCGGLITPEKRVFTSPNYPLPYTANQECAWEIRADLGYRVSLKFIDRFVVEDRKLCTKDVVIIYDWKDDAYEEMARVCGREAPLPYISTYNRLKVVFRSDAETSLDGFKAEWTPICGGKFTVTEQEQILYSPGYPINYKPNMHCLYRLRVPNNKKIQIKFSEFELEGTYPECMADNLTIYGSINYGVETIVACGSVIPVVRFYQSVTLLFRTDGSIEKKGFKIGYYTHSCGGRVNDSTILETSLSRYDYDHVNCTWFIEAPPNKIVVAKVLYINLHSTRFCDDGYIALYDGQNIHADKRLALLCGYVNSTTTLRSTENGMVFQFINDNNNFNNKGFKAAIYFSYSEAAGCGGQIHLAGITSRILKFPLTADVVYENFLDCHWSVISLPGTVIKITFNKFHITPCQNLTNSGYNKCDCDLVEIKNGINPNSLEIGTYCGYSLPPNLLSSNNMMSIRLSTDGELVSLGFEATLTVQQTVCGESVIPVSLTPRRIKSPNYEEGLVPRGLHCVYRLDTSGNYDFQQIRITITNLDLESAVSANDNRCLKDRLIISSTPYSSNSTIGKDLIMNFPKDDSFKRFYFFVSYADQPQRVELCGRRQAIDLYMFGATSINLVTSSDSDNGSYKGVEMEVALVGFCGRNYTEPQGRIFSGSKTLPLKMMYSDDVDCYTLITAQENYTISLYFITILARYYREYTYLDIFDGNNTNARRLARLDDENQDYFPAFSTGRYMLLRNHRYHTNSLKYDLNYVTTNKGVGCGGKLHNSIGAVTSPFFPNNYQSNSVCEWVLETPAGTRLVIRFNVFEIETAFDQNYVQLVDRKGMVVRTFSSEFPADYTSDDNYLKLVSHTSMNNFGRGWSAVFAGI